MPTPTDAILADETARALAVPRTTRADSFVLHTPLELLARTALLPMVEPERRAEARERFRWLGRTYSEWGQAQGPTTALTDHADADAAAAALTAGLAAGELDSADAAASWLAEHLDPAQLATATADAVLPRLSAAAHGSIFLYHLPRVAPRSRAQALMLRCLVREMAREPAWELSWFNEDLPPTAAMRDAGHELLERLRAPASPGDPGTNFIYPVMSITESSGLARDVLHPLVRSLSVADARRVLLRTAAMSMLQDEPEQAPYGWSHCLTMPQATLGIAAACRHPWQAVAVASTYVLGFRSVLGNVALDPAWEPDRPVAEDPLALLEGSPHEAAAAAWHADASARPAIMGRLASHASAHEDAHLVKYTLACIDAMHADPEATPLFLAAAAYLGAWWRAADSSG